MHLFPLYLANPKLSCILCIQVFHINIRQRHPSIYLIRQLKLTRFMLLEFVMDKKHNLGLQKQNKSHSQYKSKNGSVDFYRNVLSATSSIINVL